MAYQPVEKKLDKMDGAFIKQKFDWKEMVSGCDFPNKYNVFNLKDGEKKGKKLFQYVEKSSCLSRQCLPADCRPLNMKVKNEQQGDHDDEVCLEIVRPCKCTCCCFNRQEMQVNWTVGGQQKYIGKVVDPWDCCNYSVTFLSFLLFFLSFDGYFLWRSN